MNALSYEDKNDSIDEQLRFGYVLSYFGELSWNTKIPWSTLNVQMSHLPGEVLISIRTFKTNAYISDTVLRYFDVAIDRRTFLQESKVSAVLFFVQWILPVRITMRWCLTNLSFPSMKRIYIIGSYLWSPHSCFGWCRSSVYSFNPALFLSNATCV